MAAYDGYEPSGELQQLVHADLWRIGEYGLEHPDAYGGHWLDKRLYGVSFTGSLDLHDAALRSLLALPERLRVVQCTYTHSYLRHMQEVIFETEVKKNQDGTLRVDGVHGAGVDVRNNVVVVQVLPDRPNVEDRLVKRYGPLVSVVINGRAVAF